MFSRGGGEGKEKWMDLRKTKLMIELRQLFLVVLFKWLLGESKTFLGQEVSTRRN